MGMGLAPGMIPVRNVPNAIQQAAHQQQHALQQLPGGLQGMQVPGMLQRQQQGGSAPQVMAHQHQQHLLQHAPQQAGQGMAGQNLHQMGVAQQYAMAAQPAGGAPHQQHAVAPNANTLTGGDFSTQGVGEPQNSTGASPQQQQQAGAPGVQMVPQQQQQRMQYTGLLSHQMSQGMYPQANLGVLSQQGMPHHGLPSTWQHQGAVLHQQQALHAAGQGMMPMQTSNMHTQHAGHAPQQAAGHGMVQAHRMLPQQNQVGVPNHGTVQPQQTQQVHGQGIGVGQQQQPASHMQPGQQQQPQGNVMYGGHQGVPHPLMGAQAGAGHGMMTTQGMVPSQQAQQAQSSSQQTGLSAMVAPQLGVAQNMGNSRQNMAGHSLVQTQTGQVLNNVHAQPQQLQHAQQVDAYAPIYQHQGQMQQTPTMPADLHCGSLGASGSSSTPPTVSPPIMGGSIPPGASPPVVGMPLQMDVSLQSPGAALNAQQPTAPNAAGFVTPLGPGLIKAKEESITPPTV